MHLSELSAVCGLLSTQAAGAIVNTVHRSCNGTLIKLYGAAGGLEGIFFSTGARNFFPVTDISAFPRDPITNLEEGLRKYVGGRKFTGAALDAARGRVVRLFFGELTLVVPFFGGKAVHIVDAAGTVVWSEHPDIELPPLAEPLRDLPPRVADPLAWQALFLAETARKREEERLRRIEKEKKGLRERIAKMSAEKEKATARAAGHRATAELIKAWIYTLPAQERRNAVTLTGSDGTDATIPLDPAKTIAENMNDLFAESKRIGRGLATLDTRIAEAERIIAALDETAPAETRGTRRPAADMPRRIAGAVPGRHLPCRRFRSASGRLFLVGKSAADNDELTFKVSSPHDLWFHARDHAGSHVILRKGKGEIATEEEVFLGCCLALFYSKARNGMEGEVWFSERKFVQKKKGMPPGMVLLTQGKPKYIRADQSFFAKLQREDGV